MKPNKNLLNKSLGIIAVFVITLIWAFSPKQVIPDNYSEIPDKDFYQSKSYYQIKDKGYGFSRTESGLKEILKASRENDIEKIKSMMISGQMKTFPAGKQVVLIKQGFSTIKIKDPDTGIEYFGVSESIK